MTLLSKDLSHLGTEWFVYDKQSTDYYKRRIGRFSRTLQAKGSVYVAHMHTHSRVLTETGVLDTICKKYSRATLYEPVIDRCQGE